jgi:hypothetical protein
MADRHIAEGGLRIARQEEILTSLELRGFETGAGEKLLSLLNETQLANRAHRDAIASALDQASREPRLRDQWDMLDQN